MGPAHLLTYQVLVSAGAIVTFAGSYHTQHWHVHKTRSQASVASDATWRGAVLTCHSWWSPSRCPACETSPTGPCLQAWPWDHRRHRRRLAAKAHTAVAAAWAADRARTMRRQQRVQLAGKAAAAVRPPSAAPTPRSRSAAAPATDGTRRRRAAPHPRSACPRRPGPTARAPRPACPSAPAVALAPAHATSITRRPAARATTLVPWRHPLARQASNDWPPAAPRATPLPRAPPNRACFPARPCAGRGSAAPRCFLVAGEVSAAATPRARSAPLIWLMRRAGDTGTPPDIAPAPAPAASF